jgi:hypothetical protein
MTLTRRETTLPSPAPLDFDLASFLLFASENVFTEETP